MPCSPVREPLGFYGLLIAQKRVPAAAQVRNPHVGSGKYFQIDPCESVRKKDSKSVKNQPRSPPQSLAESRSCYILHVSNPSWQLIGYGSSLGRYRFRRAMKLRIMWANSGVSQGIFPALQKSLDGPVDEQEGTQMFRNRMAVVQAVLVVLVSTALFSQPPSTPPGSADLEFPVTMRQNVTAGVTAVGTKVQAKLAVATLVKGTVIPQNAILSGEVTESQAKSSSEPSRLAIRLDSAQWKKGSAAIKVYLTAWIYPWPCWCHARIR